MSGRYDPLDLPIGSVFQKNWTIALKLGQGGFGAVYKVQDNERQEKFYALKSSSNQAEQDYLHCFPVNKKIERTNIVNSVLKMDTNVLLKVRSKKHICRFIACGRNEEINYLIMSLAGPNLEDLFEKSPSHKFSASTTLQIAIQGVEALKDVHDAGFLHRDVKPANFALGRDSQARVLKLLDFGLARQILTNEGKLRPPRKALGFRGTERYASVNAHDSKELGRHDDLISLFYMIMEFKNGCLPWGVNDEFDVVGDKKKTALVGRLLLLSTICPSDEDYMYKTIVAAFVNSDRLDFQNKMWLMLCVLQEKGWTNIPKRLQQIYASISKWTYFKTPDYKWLMNQFALVANDEGVSLDTPFDWETEQPPKDTKKDSRQVSEYPYERQYEAEKTVRCKPKKESEEKDEEE
ncbi:tau tubulin kinase 1 [Trichuris trichiura]|uniref:Tau tubulin kinase 1 n=1 Tax=Trichuris trichiura TaxID=36087 RepID=A0A077Z8Z5_TRITR|nr:tau tubulin kinase 1 [Trichuris trichiura]